MSIGEEEELARKRREFDEKISNSRAVEVDSLEEEDSQKSCGKSSRKIAAPVWLGWHGHSATGNLATGILAARALGNRHLATGNLKELAHNSRLDASSLIWHLLGTGYFG